jgi:hypothetical protein
MSNEKRVAESLSKMIVEWVDGGIKMGTDWRSGLASVIELRLNRFSKNCQGHGRAECASCFWPKSEDLADPGVGYTAVDMTTSAAQGFRDGAASVVVELPEQLFAGMPTPNGPDLNREEVIEAIIAAGGRIKE